MLKIRLSMGQKKDQSIKLYLQSRFPKKDLLKKGFFNPLLPKTKKERVNLEVERIKHWISKGART